MNGLGGLVKQATEAMLTQFRAVSHDQKLSWWMVRVEEGAGKGASIAGRTGGVLQRSGTQFAGFPWIARGRTTLRKLPCLCTMLLSSELQATTGFLQGPEDGFQRKAMDQLRTSEAFDTHTRARHARRALRDGNDGHSVLIDLSNLWSMQLSSRTHCLDTMITNPPGDPTYEYEVCVRRKFWGLGSS
jgi:hypothetical protein